MQDNANLRQLLVATGNIFTYAFGAWVPGTSASGVESITYSYLLCAVVLFPTQDAPHYKFGYQILILFGALAVAGMFLMDFLHKRNA